MYFLEIRILFQNTKNEFYIYEVEYLPQYTEDLFQPEKYKKDPGEYIDFNVCWKYWNSSKSKDCYQGGQVMKDIKKCGGIS